MRVGGGGREEGWKYTVFMEGWRARFVRAEFTFGRRVSGGHCCRLCVGEEGAGYLEGESSSPGCNIDVFPVTREGVGQEASDGL